MSYSLVSRETLEVPARVALGMARSDFTGTILSSILFTILLYDHCEFAFLAPLLLVCSLLDLVIYYAFVITQMIFRVDVFRTVCDRMMDHVQDYDTSTFNP